MKVKAFLALALVLVMVFSGAQLAFAVDTVPSPVPCSDPSYDGSITVTKYNADTGEPIADWPISLYTFNADWVLTVYASGTTGPDGSITFDNLPVCFDSSQYKVWEPPAECWEPTGDLAPFGGTDGYYVEEILTHGEHASVDLYNRFICTNGGGGGEGCTPGYWKQSQHFDSWLGYAPTDSFSSVFGVGPDVTLLEALKARGGGENALLRHATAALLNTTAVDYFYSTGDVISMFSAAYPDGDLEGTKDAFEYQNEIFCPLD